MCIDYFSFFVYCVVFCIILSIMAQVLWIIVHQAQKKPSIVDFIRGRSAAGAIQGAVLFVLLTYMLPTVYIVGQKSYYSQLLITDNLCEQLTNTYIKNESGKKLYLVTIGYGTNAYLTKKKEIPDVPLYEIGGSISGYDEEPPRTIKSHHSGESKNYLFSTDVEINKY